jgi:L,D-peptidoglycan transpeptidase YkuD (ErfK/YbiS/YcfS/YnhG family)
MLRNESGDDLHVYANGVAFWQGQRFDCTVGKGGVVPADVKVEGDLKTPAGRYPLRQVLYRADRVEKPLTALPLTEIKHGQRWAEDPDSPDYNTLIVTEDVSEESGLWRQAHLFDLVIVVGYNDDPPTPGKGSGIFIHLANPDFTGTQGCVGFHLEDLQTIVAGLSVNSHVVIYETAYEGEG